MLSVKELVIKDEQDDFILVNPLSFTFNEGDKIAICASIMGAIVSALKMLVQPE